VSEQEFPPPRRSARPFRPDQDDEGPPPWASLPPVRSDPKTLTARPAGEVYPPASGPGDRPGVPRGRHGRPSAALAGRSEAPAGPAGSAGPGGPSGSRRPGAAPPARPREDELEPSWAQWQASAPDGEDDLPSVRAREPRGAQGGRALRAAARRRRRWLITGGAGAVLAAVAGVVLLVSSHKPPATIDAGTLVTTFQPGELQQVPNACHVVPAATVQQYLPGKAKVASPSSVSGAEGSACNWTIDQPPLYRLMELSLQAYAPSGLASGDGSATSAATDAYQLALQELRTPPRNSPSSRATVRELTGFGSAAFTAQQVFHVGGAVTDVATVVVRYRNVVVTVTLDGLAHSNRGNYGPVSPSQLAQAAMAFAQAAESSLH
jgi:hypothetical protein